MKEGDSMEKSEERNKIISELQTVIKNRLIKEIEIPGTITFQVMSVDGGKYPVGAGEVLLLTLQCDYIWNTVTRLEDGVTRKFHYRRFISFIVKSRKV